MTTESERDYRLDRYDARAASIVRDLRAMADRVERAAKPYDTRTMSGTPRHLAAASAVNHEIVWAMANISAHVLFDEAYHADQAEAEATP